MNEELELFLLRDGRGPILYAPLRHLSARINEGAVAAVSRRLQAMEPEPEDAPVIEMLEKRGFFAPAALPHTREGRAPVQVTLFPSDGCNLRCRYCYAAAAKPRHALSFSAAKAAIDYIAANAAEQKTKDFVVGFHGNGEPFTNFPLIREVCSYTRKKAEETGISGRLTVATNGALDDEKLDFLIAWFDGVNISFDGVPDLQNRQRPMPDGGESFPLVDRTLRRLEAAEKPYGIRSTLTTDSVDRLGDIARFVAENYPHCQQLHIEPAWECGRCLMTGETTPDTDEFISQFLAAMEDMPEGGPELVFSAARSGHITDRFCGAGSGSLVLTAEGLVTSCYEVCEMSDPRAGSFIYGRYDEAEGKLVFDEEKLAALHRIVVDNMPFCKDCFCKYHCAGDCPAKLLEGAGPESHHGSQRCEIARALTLAQISRQLAVAEKAEKRAMEESVPKEEGNA